jgi:flavin-dependent dehydrogenase
VRIGDCTGDTRNSQSIRNPQSATRNESSPEGYAYIFPKRDHVNIVIGYLLSHYREHVGAAPYQLQRRFVADLRDRGIVVGDSVRANFTPFIIPVGGALRQPGRGRVLLAGDAAGFVNGFTAEGIFYAMVSGELAARAVLETAGDPARMAAAYRRASDYEIGAELRDSVAIQRFLFADRGRIGRVIDGARREAALTRLILEFACGGSPYRALRRRILMRSPLVAGRLIWDRLERLVLKNSVVERRTAF